MQISKSLLSVFKISCSISVPCFLLSAEDQTLSPGSQNLLPGGRPHVGLLALAVVQAEKLRISDELSTLCWALCRMLRQRCGGFKRAGKTGVPTRKIVKASSWSTRLHQQCKM